MTFQMILGTNKQLLFYFYPGQLISSPPNSSIIGVIGESVVLPCHVVADNIPEVFSVQWIFHELSQKITVSRYDGKNKMEKQDERFQGRTEFFHSEFRAGNMSLHLKNVRSSDKGSYTCVVSFNGTYHDVLIELQVAARGGVPSIFLRSHMKQGIGLTCHAVGWFPKPEVIWLDGQGQVRKEVSTTKMTMMPAGLYSVVTSMNLKPGSDMESPACKIKKTLSKWHGSNFYVMSWPEDVFPESVLEKIPITVDENTAHPNLSIAVDKKSFTHKSEAQKVTQNEESFDSFVCVLGLESFSSGKHYWEVDVEKSNDWDLGVARKSAPRKGIMSLSPEEGFWALGFSFKCYWARTEPWTRLAVQRNPRKVGVYLNCEEKILTFFNVTDMSVMFTFKDCAFSEEVYPFFKNSHKESTMRICSVKEE
uniref:Butyrophilin subfamily 1 member A1 n=1 Tax=Aquila chrysaetos chrysaetos TaxID=223781 RepID=A0A663EZA0_AQUCH